MRSVVYTKSGGMNAIDIVESPTPSPAKGEVLIEVHRAGINFADLMMRQGLYSPVPSISIHARLRNFWSGERTRRRS